MKIENSNTYPRIIRVDPIKESYVIKKEYCRKNPYKMSQRQYCKRFFAGTPTMKTVMRILGLPKGSEIRIIDGAPEGTKLYNRHMITDLFHQGEVYYVGLWIYSSGEIDMWVRNLATGEKNYHQLKSQNSKDFIKLARNVRDTYLK